MRDLTEEWMQRYFDYLSEGTLAEGGKIIMTRIPVAFRCEACAHTFSADIRQNTAVTAIPVAAWGTMIFRNAARRE